MRARLASRLAGLLGLVLILAASPAALAFERVRDIAGIAGVRVNQLIGYGVIVGLDGSGDATNQVQFTGQSVQSLLSQFGVTLPPGVTPQMRNVAAVMVTAQLPAFAQPGQQVDVTVSSLGNARSLRGGTLLLTPLRGADSQVYAMAQGSLLVTGAGAQAGGSKVSINHLLAAMGGEGPLDAHVPEQAQPLREAGHPLFGCLPAGPEGDHVFTDHRGSGTRASDDRAVAIHLRHTLAESRTP